MRRCITHHHACDCRENFFNELESKAMSLASLIALREGVGDAAAVNSDNVKEAKGFLKWLKKRERSNANSE